MGCGITKLHNASNIHPDIKRKEGGRTENPPSTIHYATNRHYNTFNPSFGMRSKVINGDNFKPIQIEVKAIEDALNKLKLFRDGNNLDTNGFLKNGDSQILSGINARLVSDPIMSPMESNRRPPESIFRPPESILRPHESIIRPPESILRPHESILRPPESIIRPPESIIRPTHSSISEKSENKKIPQNSDLCELDSTYEYTKGVNAKIGGSDTRGAGNIHYACKTGDIDEVRRILRIDPSAAFTLGMWNSSPLMISIQYNHNDIAMLLLTSYDEQIRDKIHQKNDQGCMVLTIACMNGCMEIIDILLSSYDADPNPPHCEGGIYNPLLDHSLPTTPLAISCTNNNVIIASKLYERCTNLSSSQNSELDGSGDTYTFPFVTIPPKICARRKVRTGLNLSPLMVACFYGSYDVVEMLLKRKDCGGMHKDSFGCTALHYLLRGHHVHLLSEIAKQSILSSGDTSNATEHKALLYIYVLKLFETYLFSSFERLLHSFDCDGMTVLHIAVENNLPAVVSYLLTKGCSPSAIMSADNSTYHTPSSPKDGPTILYESPLHIAMRKKLVKISLILLDNPQCDIYKTDSLQVTCLQLVEKLPPSCVSVRDKVISMDRRHWEETRGVKDLDLSVCEDIDELLKSPQYIQDNTPMTTCSTSGRKVGTPLGYHKDLHIVIGTTSNDSDDEGQFVGTSHEITMIDETTAMEYRADPNPENLYNLKLCDLEEDDPNLNPQNPNCQERIPTPQIIEAVNVFVPQNSEKLNVENPNPKKISKNPKENNSENPNISNLQKSVESSQIETHPSIPQNQDRMSQKNISEVKDSETMSKPKEEKPKPPPQPSTYVKPSHDSEKDSRSTRSTTSSIFSPVPASSHTRKPFPFQPNDSEAILLENKNRDQDLNIKESETENESCVTNTHRPVRGRTYRPVTSIQSEVGGGDAPPTSMVCATPKAMVCATPRNSARLQGPQVFGAMTMGVFSPSSGGSGGGFSKLKGSSFMPMMEDAMVEEKEDNDGHLALVPIQEPSDEKTLIPMKPTQSKDDAKKDMSRPRPQYKK